MDTRSSTLANEVDDLTMASSFPVSFAVFALARAHKTVAASLLARLGLYPNQEILLMRLWQRDCQSQKELVDSLGLDHSTVVRSVQRMEAAGLLTRRKSTADARVTLVSLSDRGRELRDKAVGVWAELESRSTQDLSKAEQSTFLAIAGKIIAQLD